MTVNINSSIKTLNNEQKINSSIQLYKNFNDNEILMNEEKDYINLKKKIMSDNTIDNQMKSILLQSKKEYLEKLKKNINSQTELKIHENTNSTQEIISNQDYDLLNSNNLSPELNDLIREINKKCLKSKNYQNYKDFLMKKIKNFNENKINIIYLEFEMCWDIYKIINNKIFDPNKKNKLFEIIKPSNKEEYDNYVKIIEMSKRDYNKKIKKEKEEKKRLDEEMQKKKENERLKKIKEEKDKIEMINREKIISILQNNFKKLSFYDNETKEIQNDSYDSIIKYLNLETDFIQLDSQLYSRFNKFIDSIRITSDEKKCIVSSISIK